jgi:glutamine synthetase
VDNVQADWHVGGSANLGYQVPHKSGYHIAPPSDRFAGFRSRAVLLMEKLGITVKYHHHEVGSPCQHEIELEPGRMSDMADRTMLSKYILKNLAIKEGMSVTFLPKPLVGEAGSGLHVHLQLFKEGKPLFYDANGYSQLSDTALYFMGGILKHAPALCAFTNPSTNSYKRLTPGYEAPVTIGYATSNRSAVVRIPAYAKAPEAKRYELRSPDGTCNPYYAFAAILMAGLDGVQNKTDPAKAGYGPYDFNLYTLSERQKKKIKSLPKSLDEALDALERDRGFLAPAFPERLITLWLENKRAEAAKVSQYPHPVEYSLYYDL